MSHAALVNAGLLYVVVVQPLLLMVFVRAVIRAPSGPADSPNHPEPEQPAVAAPPPPEPTRLPARPTGRPVDAVGLSGEAGYVGRHATQGGPPWGPAPKPPGAAW